MRTPNRPRSLLAAARAAQALGDETGVRQHYAQLVATPGAEADLPGLDEARAFPGETSQP